MAIKKVKISNLDWIYINPISKDDIGYLEHNYHFHPLDLKDCLEGVQRPKMDVYKRYVFLIFHFPYYNDESKRVETKPLNIFIGKNFIVTLSKEIDTPLFEYFSRVRKSQSKHSHTDSFWNTSGYKLYKTMDIEYRNSLNVINVVGDFLEDVEDEVYSNKNKEATMNLAVIRRNILSIRRILEPQLKMVDRLVHMRTPFFTEKLSVYLDDVHDYMENMWSALENHKDSIDGLYNTNESFINQRTNEVIKMLTVISVALLPLTLIASIYGMNVIGLPFATHPSGLWLIFLVMGVMVTGAIYFAKKRNII